jgi:E3 ubiquitin-protein ligase synoviolin
LLGLQKLLFGPLRPIEIEQLYEKAWFAVTETCLAMTIFRGEIGGWFLIMFFSLLTAKVWGWIGEGRVEVLEQQQPQNPRLFHTRLAISLSISVLFDSYMLEYLVKEVLHQARPDMMVMFGFEFAVLTILSSSTMARYAISLVEIYIVRKQKEKRVEEIRRERRAAAVQATAEAPNVPRSEGTASEPSVAPAETSATAGHTPTIPAAEDPIDDAEVEVEGWEEKGRWVFYLDLATGRLFLPHRSQSYGKLIYPYRLPQARRLPIVLFHSSCILRTSHPHHARRFPYLQIFLQAHFRFCQIPDGHERHEREIS